MNDYLAKYIIVHLVCSLIGLSTHLINERELRVRDFLWALIFGWIWMLMEFNDLDRIIIKLPESKK